MRDAVKARRRPRLLIGGLAVIVLLGAGGAYLAIRPSAASALTLGEVGTGTLSQSLTGSGTVTSVGTLEVAFPASARVTAVDAVVGDTVTAGQVLATIDSTALSDALDEAELKVRQAEQNLAEAQDTEDEDTTSTTTETTAVGSTGSTTSTVATASARPSSVPTSATTSAPSATASTSARPSEGASTSRPSASPTTTPSADQPGQAPSEADVAKLVENLEVARAAFDAAWQSFSDDLAAATAECVASMVSPEPSATPSPESSDTPTPTPSGTPSPEPSAEPSEDSASDGSSTGATTATNVEHVVSRDDCIAALESLEDVEAALIAARDRYDSWVDQLVDAAKAGAASDGADTPGDGQPSAAPTSQPSASSPTSQPSASSPTPQPTNQPSATPTGGTSDTGTGSAGTAGSQAGSGGGADTSATGSGDTGTGGSPTGSNGGMGGTATTVAQAEAALESAELDHANAQLALAGATLRAPADGVLTALPFTVGQAATTSQVAAVKTSDQVSVPIEVAVDDIGQVAVGQEAVVTSDTGGTSSGTVGSIALLPTDSSGSYTYTVTIAVGERDATLLIGTSATVDVTVASSSDSVLVPISAVTLTGDDSGTVQVVEDGQARSQEVKLGVRGATHVEVAEGLSAGDRVVLSDPSLAIPTSDTSTTGRGGLGGGFQPGGATGPGR